MTLSLDQTASRAIGSKLALSAVLLAHAGAAFARAPNAVPEPSVISLIGGAVVVGILAYRIKRKK